MKLFTILFQSASKFTWIAVFISLFDGIASIGLVAMVQQVLSSGGSASLQQIGIFVGLCVTVLVTKIASQIVLTRIAERSVSAILMSLCRRIAAAPLRDLERIGPHKALSAITVDVGVLAAAIQGIPVLIGNALALLVGLLYLGYLSFSVMLGAIAFIFLGYWSFQWTASFGTKYIRAAREQQDELTKHLRLLIDGIKELKMHQSRMDSFLNNAIMATNQLVRENQTIGFTIQGTAISWGRLMFFIAIGTLLFCSHGLLGLNQASLTACALVVLFLMTPVERIIAWLPLLARAKIAIAKIESFGDLDRELEESQSSPLPRHFQSIIFSDITFQYEKYNEERTFAFGPLDFTLNNGEVVFLVGGNGSGKTTFLKLLTGLYEPDVGRIFLDDLEITCHNRESYRQLFAVVFAEPVLFDSLHGLAWQDDQQLKQLLKHLELDKKVQIVDGRLSSTELSKGQRKRLALLTAYLEDRPIYVFDEWAADQDPIYKRVFYEQILPSLQQSNRTVVVISHDDQYYAKGDRIVHLADGQISSVEPSLAIQSNDN